MAGASLLALLLVSAVLLLCPDASCVCSLLQYRRQRSSGRRQLTYCAVRLSSATALP